jgi:zinc protease
MTPLHSRLAALLLASCLAAPVAVAQDPILMPVPNDPTVSFAVWFKVGSQNDPKGKEGLAALTAGLIQEGATTSNSYEQILQKLYPLASRYGLSVDKEMTVLSGRTHVDNIEGFFPLFTDAYLKPAFTAADFERVRTNLMNEIANDLRNSSEEELAKAALTSLLYAGTPYAHPIQGTVEGLKAIKLDDVKAFYQQHYTRANAVPALGGGYPASLTGRFVKSLDGLPAGQPGKVTIAPAAGGPQVLLVQKPGADSSISFGVPIDVHRGSDEFYALWLANSWLGEHRASVSHLFQVIRERRGMNYGDYSYIEAFPNGGQRNAPPANVGRHHQFFEVWIRTLSNDNAVFAIRAARRLTQRLIDQGLTEEEFQLTRSFLKKYHLHFAETTDDRLAWRIDDAFYGIKEPGHLAQFSAKLDGLTREKVNAAIKKHWKVGDLRYAIVTGQAEKLKGQLASGAATPPTYPIAKSDEIKVEDKEIEVFPLGIKADSIEIVPVETIFEK